MSANNSLVNKESKDNGTLEMTYEGPVFTPRTDIYEEGENIYVICDIPGVSENNVDINLENKVLSISARQDKEEIKDYELLHEGYLKGTYQRSFTINEGIDREKISASLDKGVLTLKLPKSEALKPKKIKVNG